jgi:hypothetical protein
MSSGNLPVYVSLPAVAALVFSLMGGAVLATYAQGIPGMTQVSGKYANDAVGVEIVFPDGWEGIEVMTEETLSVSTTAGGFTGQLPTKFIGLAVVPKALAEQQQQDPRDPSSYATEPGVQCGTPDVHTIQVSGKSGYEITIECTYPDGRALKTKTVMAQTATRWVTVSYTNLGSDFSADEAKFDAAVNTLRIRGVIDFDPMSNLGQELKSVIHSVLVKGKNVDLALKTTSTISNFKLEEQEKKISFAVDGPTGTPGTTTISIGQVLEGPYVVTIDGTPTTNFQVTDEGTSEAMMEISYTHSVHEITVTGTNVVPEFPVVVLGVIAAVIGAVAVITRFSPLGVKI